VELSLRNKETLIQTLITLAGHNIQTSRGEETSLLILLKQPTHSRPRKSRRDASLLHANNTKSNRNTLYESYRSTIKQRNFNQKP